MTDHSLESRNGALIEELRGMAERNNSIQRHNTAALLIKAADALERSLPSEIESSDALDAARYRWVREVSVHNGDYLPERFWELLGDALGDDFDAMIDNAMKGKP